MNKKVTISIKALVLALLITPIMALISCTDDEGDPIIEGIALRGTISNALNGDPLDNATVTLSGAEQATQTTDTDGQYRFDNLIIGTYQVTANHPDFESNSIDVTVQSLQDARGDITLTPTLPFELTPSQIDFGSAVSVQEITIRNTTGAGFSFEIQEASDWLMLDKTGGSVPSLSTDLIELTIDREQLPIGNSTTSIVFNVPGRGSQSVQVLAEKLDPTSASLQVNVGTLNFGEDLSSTQLEISNTGSATLTWSVNVSENWLSTNPVTGTVTSGSTSTIDVFVIRDGLANGDYTGTLNFTGNGGSANVVANMSVNISGGGSGDPNGDDDNDNVINAIDADDDGDGLIDIYTINDLYNIRDDLQALGTNLQGAPPGGFIGYELMNDLDFSLDTDYSDLSLKSDVSTGSGWDPIGTSSNPLSTEFEGNGFTISELLINNTTDFNGIFGYGNLLSKIRNLNVEIKFFSARNYNGGIIGWTDGDVIGCSVKGDISATGLSGLLVGELGQGDVTSCFTEGNINGSGSYIGGLIGRRESFTSETSTISKSSSSANVSSDGSVGGLIGSLNRGTALLKQCYATGNVTSSNWYAGGLVGFVTSLSTVSSCYSTGNTTSTTRNVGGFIGTASSGNVTTSYSTGTPIGTSVIGGFLGSGSAGSTSYWDTSTSGFTTSSGEEVGLTTSELQGPTSDIGIYVTWDPNIWDFGTFDQYPVLKDMPLGLNAQRP